jgi:hypothetical protein
MTTYWGNCGSDGSLPAGSITFDSEGGLNVFNKNVVWTANFSGPVTDIELWCRANTGVPVVRLAVYSLDGATKMAEGSSATAIPTDSIAAWRGHTGGGVTSLNNVVSGISYKVDYTMSTNIEVGKVDSAASDASYDLTDYTAGFPSTLPTAAGDVSFTPVVRVGGTDAAAPSAFVQWESMPRPYSVRIETIVIQ